jgi:hypothetical protein
MEKFWFDSDSILKQNQGKFIFLYKSQSDFKNWLLDISFENEVFMHDTGIKI